MADLRTLGATSNRVRFTLKDKTTGQGKTGLSILTSGLIISTIADNEASATAYTQAGSTIETIATLGTFATPTATKCRFKEVDSTNHKGLYEFQFANARFAVASAKRLVISVNDAESTILDGDYEVEFTNDLVASVWDEVNTGATHNVANSTGKQVRSISGNTDVIYSSTLPSQAGVASNQVKLDTGASSSDGAYVGDRMSAVGASTGQGSLICIAYVGSTRLATLNSTWAVVPIAGDTVEVTPAATAQVVSYITGQDPATLVWAAGSRTITGGTITTYTGNTPQTGDAFARLGAPSGASISADVAAIKSDTGTILTDVNVGAGAIYTRLGAPAGASVSADIAAIKTDLDAGVSIDAAGIRTALGMASANLDTQLAALPTDAEISDKLLGRNIGGGSDGGRTVAEAMAFLRNRWVISAGTLTVYATNDSTTLWTATVVTTAGNPITTVDPA